MQSDGRLKTRSVYRQSIPPLCHGCLSADRELSSSSEFANIYRNLCDIKTPVAGRSTDIYLCWECTALLKRLHTFCKQVNNAQTILNSIYYDHKKKKSLPQSLSRLKTTQTNHDYIILSEPEPDIKPLETIKQEIEQEEEFYNDNKDLLDDSEFTYLEKEIEQKEEFDNDNKDFLDDSEFTYLEEIRSEDPTLIIKLQKIKKENNIQVCKKKKLNYCYIQTPEKMIESMQARQTDFCDLWERDRHILAGSGANCAMCLKEFSKSESIETHNSKYHDEHIGPHVCTICRTRYPTQADLASHITTHNTIYCCIVCGHRSLNMEDALSHASGHRKVVKCKLCRYYCMNVQPDYYTHYKSMHIKFLCDNCGKKCKSKRVLRRHITRKHMESKCGLCGVVFVSYKKLRNHHLLVHETDRSEASFCVKCNVQFQNRARYQRHLHNSAAHARERQHSKDREPIKCLLCDKRYTRRSYMMNHYRFVHMAKTKYYCQECDKYFLNSSKYRYHRQYVHEGQQQKKDKMCSHCGRGFTTNRILTHHMRTHTGERPHECAQCGARFAQPTARDIHQRRHNKNSDKT